MFLIHSIILSIGLLLGTIGDAATNRIHPDGRIVGGHDADIADYPYQVSISTEGQAFCGGSLISPTWVLTSAHCMTDGKRDLTAAELTVLANSSHINSGVERSVAKIVAHPNFSYATGDSDIALIQLTTPLECVHCKPIALARHEPKRGDIVVLTGWGRISEDDFSDGSEILQYVKIPFLKRNACQKMYKNTDEIITDNMFCAHYPGGGKDSCIGDSGGPAVIDDVLYGVVSWGIGCAEAEYPGVYTNVPKFLDWIKEHSGVKP